MELFAFLQEHCSKSNWLASIVLMVSGWQAASLTTSRLHSYIPLDTFYASCFEFWVLYSEHHIFFCKPTSGLPHLNCKQSLATFIGRSARCFSMFFALSEFRSSLGELKLRTQIFKNKQPGWLPAKMLQEALHSGGRFTLLVDVFLSRQDWAWCLRKHPRHISHAPNAKA